MKKFFIAIISFLMPLIIYAEDNIPYLTDLYITNGVNTLNFDKMNDLYTINVYDDIESLDIQYKLEYPDTKVIIIGNDNLSYGPNDIYLNLDYEGVENSYHLIVNKIDNTLPTFMDESTTQVDHKYIKVFIVLSYIVINIVLFWLLIIKPYHKNK